MQHNAQCPHSHNHRNQHGHHSNPHEMTLGDYLTKCKELLHSQPVFFAYEILSGVMFIKICQKSHLQFIKFFNCQILATIILSLQRSITFNWIPLKLRPFLSGLFIPMCLLFYFNFIIITYNNNYHIKNYKSKFIYIAINSIFWYVITVLRGSGNLNHTKNHKKTFQAFQERPYLQVPHFQCHQCKILKVFRSNHCPFCSICIPKFSYHSIIFGVCIGACNQFFAVLFLFSTYVESYYSFYLIQFLTDYGFLTKFLLSSINLYISWVCLRDTFKLCILNIAFGITEHQIMFWNKNQYLMKIQQQSFLNNCDNGLVHNFKQTFYAAFGIGGCQSQSQKKQNLLHLYDTEQNQGLLNRQFEILRPKNYDQYIVNWGKAFFYLIPQMPNHKMRKFVIQIMLKEEPRMIEAYKIQKQMRQQVQNQIKQQGLQLNSVEKQQKILVKMQQHFLKNASPQQQQNRKQMMLQMLKHMQKQLSVDDLDLAQKCKILQNKLNNNQIKLIDVSNSIKEIQHELMAKKMQKIIKLKELQSQNANQQIDPQIQI